MIELGENRYGKSRVRLVRVKRDKQQHHLREWTLQILLQGDFETCFTDADNSKILPTDTMKNTVYSLARKSTTESMEAFAKEMVDFFLGRNPQVTHAEVSVWEKAWNHLSTRGKSHPTTFVQSNVERQTAIVGRSQDGSFSVVSGLEGLTIMKTAQSGFENYVQDSLTTLPPTADRLLGTTLTAKWQYSSPDAPWDKLRTSIRDILITSFAEHDSKSVQHTLYAMGEAVLKGVADVREIELVMPNIHCLLVDLSRFGQDNPNEIFVPIDEPHGYIEARVRRG